MKKYIVVAVALLYSFIGVNMVFADGDTWTHFNHKGITKPKISAHISPLSEKSKFAEVVLQSSMSRGYVWSYALRKEGIVQEVSHKNIGGDSCRDVGNGLTMCTTGVPGKEIWTFKGLHEGETIAEFTLSHIHDSNLIEETIKILFTVNRRLEVKATYVTEVTLETSALVGNSLSYPLWGYTLSKQGVVQEISRAACSPFVSCMCIEGSACTCPDNCADGEETWTFKGLREGETIAEFTHDTIGDKKWILFKVNRNLEIEAIYLETQ